MNPRDLPEDAPDIIFGRAAERARANGLPYCGAVTPAEAWQLAQSGAAHIVDVRTHPEWEFVGHVPDSTLIEWRRYGDPGPDPAAFVRQLAGRFSPEDKLLFLCRSAVRSHHAADVARRAGFRHAFNILEGFEGDMDARGQRGSLGGWRNAGLPWVQG